MDLLAILEEDPVIESSCRFEYLFPHSRRDENVYILYNNKEAMLPQLPMLYGMKRESLLSRRESQRTGFQERSLYLDVVCKESKELVCFAGFRALDNENECAEWGIIVVPEWRQRGVAREVFLSNIHLLEKINRNEFSIGSIVKTRNIIYREIKASTLPLNQVMIEFLIKRGLEYDIQVNDDEWLRFSGNIDAILLACVKAVPSDGSTKIKIEK